MIRFLAIWIISFLGMSTSNASIYTGSFKQSEFRYVKSIERHTCANAYRTFREKIVAPSGWYFEIAPDSLCSFRLTQVKKKKNRIDDLYVHIMPNDSEQIDWPVEKIKNKMNEVRLDVDLIEISSHGEKNSVSSRSFLQIDKKKVVTRIDEFKANGFDLIVLRMSSSSVEKLNTTSKIYSQMIHAIMEEDN